VFVSTSRHPFVPCAEPTWWLQQQVRTHYTPTESKHRHSSNTISDKQQKKLPLKKKRGETENKIPPKEAKQTTKHPQGRRPSCAPGGPVLVSPIHVTPRGGSRHRVEEVDDLGRALLGDVVRRLGRLAVASQVFFPILSRSRSRELILIAIVQSLPPCLCLHESEM